MGWCCSLEIFVIWIELWISGFGVLWFSFICGELSHSLFLPLLFFCFEVLNLGLGAFFFFLHGGAIWFDFHCLRWSIGFMRIYILDL